MSYRPCEEYAKIKNLSSERIMNSWGGGAVRVTDIIIEAIQSNFLHCRTKKTPESSVNTDNKEILLFCEKRIVYSFVDLYPMLLTISIHTCMRFYV